MNALTNEQIPMNDERLTGRPRRGSAARRLGVGIAAAVLVGALPAAAGAADYCVNTSCGGTNVASLDKALDLADNDTTADRILLGTGDFTALTAGGFEYNRADAPLEIVGQGAGQTTLTGQPNGNSWVLRLRGGAGSSVHDLTIQLPQNAAAGFSGLSTDNLARRIEVVEHPTQTNYRRGVDLQNGGALEDSSVTLGSGQQTWAVRFHTGGGTVRRSLLTGRTGVVSNYGGTIERSRLTGTSDGVQAYRSVTAIAGSVIRFGAGGAGIAASVQSGSDTTVDADGVTIVGPGLPDTRGATVSTFLAPAQNAGISLTNSIIRGVEAALTPGAPPGGTGQAKVSATYSDYDPSGNYENGANASISKANVSNVGEAGFVNAAGGDYRLLPTSPLIDIGDPTTAPGLDLDGNALVADGNGDGDARRDLGAFELQPGQGAGGGGQLGDRSALDTQAPLVGGFRAAPSLFAVARAGTPVAARLARGTRFRYTLTEQARVTLKIQRALPGRRVRGKCVRPSQRLTRAKRCIRYRTVGALTRNANSGTSSTSFTGRLGKRALRPGRYRALITATDTAGNRSAPRSARFRIAGR
jgi:hypothetical protein